MAQDTLDGIAEWWVLEQGVEQRVMAVKDALARLVAQGFVLQGERTDGRVYYKLNQSMLGEVRRLLSIPVN
jgi:DNA-binding transcriptional regulator PaaX